MTKKTIAWVCTTSLLLSSFTAPVARAQGERGEMVTGADDSRGEAVFIAEEPAKKPAKKPIWPWIVGAIAAAAGGYMFAEEKHSSDEKAAEAKETAAAAEAAAAAAATAGAAANAAAAEAAAAAAAAVPPPPEQEYILSLAGTFVLGTAVNTSDCGAVTPSITFSPSSVDGLVGKVTHYVITTPDQPFATNTCGTLVNSDTPYQQTGKSVVFISIADDFYHGTATYVDNYHIRLQNGSVLKAEGGSARLVAK